jgi:Domain of unknown function (DUF4430)
MSRPRRTSGVAAVLLAAAGLAGCGFGAGESSEGTATLLVTRDYGAKQLVDAGEEDPAESDTVMRFLDREAEITTRYGGGFVQSIEGLASTLAGGRSHDWFFYVNGIESPVGAAESSLRGGDRVWWDYHDWTDVMRVPAVVGSFPEPFLQRPEEDDRAPVEVVCAGSRDHCEETGERLAEAGVETAISSPPSAGQEAGPLPGDEDALRLLVGPWDAVREDPAAAQLERGPEASGVFAEFRRRAAGWQLVAFDERARAATRLDRSAGLVAALRAGEDPATWVVTGSDRAGVEGAVGALDEDALAGRFALAVAGGRGLALPVASGEEGEGE